MKKLSNTDADLKKSVAYKKSVYIGEIGHFTLDLLKRSDS